MAIPVNCPGVPPEVLLPRNTWKDKAAYDAKALELAKRFVKNFADIGKSAAKEIEAAGPKV